jgi:hypothetical protein
MYREIPLIFKPKSENTIIWRYLDFTKFVSLLENRSIFFCRADMLGDKFEGAFTNKTLQLRDQIMEVKKVPEEFRNHHRSYMQKITSCLRKWTAINCWHMNEGESAAMWKLYVKNNEGVAIESTFSHLVQSFAAYSADDIYIGIVRYVDPDSGLIPEHVPYSQFFAKQPCFQHERELRAVVQRIPEGVIGNYTFNPNIEIWKNGLQIPVELNILVDRIRIAPTAPDWFTDLVKRVIHKYGFEWEVTISDMMKDPII